MVNSSRDISIRNKTFINFSPSRLILYIIFFVNVICTYLSKSSKNFASNKFCKMFNMEHNLSNIMRLNHSKSHVKCIDGMKVLAALYIIVGHRMFFSFKEKRLYGWQGSVKKFLMRYDFGLDVFFVCSGVLITMSLLRNLQK